MRARAEGDAGAVGEALAGLADPVEQVVLVRVAHEVAPISLKEVCKALQGQPAEPDCARLRDRAHLRFEPAEREEDPDALPPRRGMILDQVRLRPLPTDRLGGEAVDVCLEAELRVRCQANAAVERARAGDAEGAWGRCLALEAGRSRDECAFRSAEALVRDTPELRRATELVAPAMELCLAADSFQGQCLVHLTQALGDWAPMELVGTEASWARVEAARAAGVALLDGLEPGLGKMWAERLLAEAAWRSVARLQPLEALPLPGLPEVARPHLRGAAALVLLQEQAEGDLDQLVARLAELEVRPPVVDPSAERRPPGPARLEPQADLWTRDHDSESGLPSVPLAGRVRRTRHEEPVLDRQIVLMEAAAQVTPPRLELLRAGLDSPDERVRWTAVRLLACVDEGWEAGAFAEDPSPAVVHRATSPCEIGGPGFMPGGGGKVGPGVQGGPPRGPRAGPGGGPGRGPGGGPRGGPPGAPGDRPG